MASSIEDREDGGGGGCAPAILIMTVVVVLVLVGVGLFLPPFSLYQRLFGTQYTALNETGASIGSVDGAFRVSSTGQAFGAALDSTSLVMFTTANDPDSEWIIQARSAIPYYLALQSDVYHLELEGKPVSYALSVEQPTTAIPEVLDLYGYERDTAKWSFIPSQRENREILATTRIPYDAVALFQAAPLPPKIIVEYDTNQFLNADVAALADIVAPAGLQPTLTGALTGSLAPGFDLAATYEVMPVVRDFADPRAVDTETVIAILNNSDLRKEHVRQLSSLAVSNFDGVWLDYRGIPDEQRANFSAFMRELRVRFAEVGLKLGVIVPSAVLKEGIWDTGAYDWQVIGANADYVQVNMPLAPTLYIAREDQFVEQMLAWGVGEINRTKLLLGVSARSVRDINGVQTLVGYDEGLSALGDVVVTPETVNDNGIVPPGATIRAKLDGKIALAGVDTRVNAPYIDYMDDTGAPVARIWLTTSDALRWRLDTGTAYALAGAGFNDLLNTDLASGVYKAISDYRLQIPSSPSPTDLVLRWRVEGTNGTLQEVITSLGEELVTTMNAQDGNYAVNVAVVGTGEDVEESVRSGAVVAMFAATPTPTPLPTATATPLPTMTPTPLTIIATAVPVGGNAPLGNGFGALAPGAGSIRLGQFEYGGHVSSAGSRAIEAMKRAGMTWLKVQMRYTPGANAAEAAGYISAAQSNGFKILLGTVGNASDLANGGDGYISGYTNWLAAIASMGPNAMEVWNEPNLDREWPNGQISGAAYASLLKTAYSAIKRTNASVIVISAAPGPTGAEAAYPGAVVNDDRWLADMVAAGGLGYADCVGVHYNEGIVPPSASSGDPRDNYYTRYFPLMIDTYWNITGGQKPLCFTELGFLTPEGFGAPLDPYFGWAANVTVSQHAAWLAQAAALSSQSGKVKLMIVWNVDFSNFGTDPMGGWAMIRPDGSCPACDTLAAAR